MILQNQLSIYIQYEENIQTTTNVFQIEFPSALTLSIYEAQLNYLKFNDKRNNLKRAIYKKKLVMDKAI